MKATIAQSLLLLFLLTQFGAAQEYELSYLLLRASDQTVLHSQQAKKLRTPASTLKIVTAAGALEHLGADHTFQTELRASAPILGTNLESDLHLVGSADPELTEEELKSLASQLWDKGLRTINGDLVVDPGPFSFPLYGSGWAWDDSGHSYSPEITGLNLNSGVWALDPENLPLWVHHHPEQNPKGRWMNPGQEGILIQGALPELFTPPRTALRTGTLLQDHLQTRGIRIQGRVRIGAAQGQPLALHSSRPVHQLLKRALELSDNLAMELLFRASGKQRPSALKEAELRIADGSGLSRYNLISAEQLVEVLRTNPELKTLLPNREKAHYARDFKKLGSEKTW